MQTEKLEIKNTPVQLEISDDKSQLTVKFDSSDVKAIALVKGLEADLLRRKMEAEEKKRPDIGYEVRDRELGNDPLVITATEYQKKNMEDLKPVVIGSLHEAARVQDSYLGAAAEDLDAERRWQNLQAKRADKLGAVVSSRAG